MFVETLFKIDSLRTKHVYIITFINRLITLS